MNRTGGAILRTLAGATHCAAHVAAVRFAVGGDYSEFCVQLGALEDADLVVEDRHRRGVLVLTAIGAVVESHLSVMPRRPS